MKKTLISVFALTLLTAPFSFSQAVEDAHHETHHDHAAGGVALQECLREVVELYAVHC